MAELLFGKPYILEEKIKTGGTLTLKLANRLSFLLRDPLIAQINGNK